jgi:hypothetical protein
MTKVLRPFLNRVKRVLAVLFMSAVRVQTPPAPMGGYGEIVLEIEQSW